MIRHWFMILAVCCGIVLIHCRALAQVDLRGCSVHGVDVLNPQSIESSLWTFRSNVWDGYIDFQENGKYWTHWGYGTWKVNDDGQTIHLANDYNERTYEVGFSDNGFRFQGIRNDGLMISGNLICSKYQGPGPEVPNDVSKKIISFYRIGMEREPEKVELITQYRLYLQGKTVDEILQGLRSTEEFKTKDAVRKKKEMEFEQQALIE